MYCPPEYACQITFVLCTCYTTGGISGAAPDLLDYQSSLFPFGFMLLSRVFVFMDLFHLTIVLSVL